MVLLYCTPYHHANANMYSRQADRQTDRQTDTRVQSTESVGSIRCTGIDCFSRTFKEKQMTAQCREEAKLVYRYIGIIIPWTLEVHNHNHTGAMYSTTSLVFGALHTPHIYIRTYIRYVHVNKSVVVVGPFREALDNVRWLVFWDLEEYLFSTVGQMGISDIISSLIWISMYVCMHCIASRA